jgi:phage tail tape-measure protein
MDLSLIAGTLVIAFVLILIVIIVLVKQSKSGLNRGNTGNISEAMGKGMGIGISIGAGTGAALGAALGNIALGIAIGTGIGLSLGAALGVSFKRTEEESQRLHKDKRPIPTDRNTKLPLAIGIVVLLIGMLVTGLFYLMKIN